MADPVNQVFDDLGNQYADSLGLTGGYRDVAKQLLQRQQLQEQAQQKYAGLLDQQYNQLAGQTGMDPYTKAAMLFQGAGALSAPTRSGGFGESLGALGTALSGPLMQQAQAERSRQEKLQQLQLARAKMATEMQLGPDPAKSLELLKAQQNYEIQTKKIPTEFDTILSQLPPEDRQKALRVKAGLEEAAGKTKQKDVSDTTLQTFTEGGGALSDLDDLSARFKPEYGGKIIESVGDVQNLAGSKGFGYKDQSQWWSDYAERRNILRNSLFGSAVTKPEKEEFLKADITPGMDPELIKQKLARQREVSRAAAYKLAKAKQLQGFDIEPIEAAIGYKLEDLEKSAMPKKTEKSDQSNKSKVVDFGSLR
jgi:hypothetical protein